MLFDDSRSPNLRRRDAAALFVNAALGIVRRLRPRHAPYALLGITVALSDLLFRLQVLNTRKRSTPQNLTWGIGLSIVVPHRHGVEMLDQCLARIAFALDRVDEPCEIIVVVNGSAMAEYELLRARYPAVRWLFFPEPLGFTGAVLKGVAKARHGAIYLLNDDMLLEPEALITALSCRGPQVFAVASQIFFQDSERRREETGWTAMTVVNGLPRPRHETPLGPAVRGTVWAGAGSALFHAGLLRELMPGCLPFDPFYWEDVDLGVRAWRLGYESLICPVSVAWHKHRATVEKFYAAEYVERIVERNRLLFQLRNPFPRQSLKATLQHVAHIDRDTLRELGSWRSCLDLWRVRWRAFRAPHRDMDYPAMWTREYPRPARPSVVIVSPFVVLPPMHGGAVRIHQLVSELAKDFDVILVSDEGERYSAPSKKGYAPFSCVHLVRDRPDEPAGQETNRITRVQSHSRRALKDELCRVIDLYQPVAVLMEYMELGGLIDISPAHRPKYILSIHDVLLCPGDPSQAEADRFESGLIDRFDGLVVSSVEDQALLGNRAARLVPNG
jgi:GT2 family glycosyltransferase